MKGTVIISETLLEIVGVIISFILIVLVIQLVFQSQTQATYQSAFQSVARDISTAIDRAVAASGSLYIQQDLPKGLNVNVSIDYKTVIVSSKGNAARKSFSGLTNTPPTYFVNPTTLCVVKTQNDNKVSVVSGVCQCNPNDNKCDPVCSTKGICDPACINSTTGVCNQFCAMKNPDACDINCYSNYPTGICEKNCIKPNATDGICSPDCANITKNVCDMDCYNQYSNGAYGVCDPDCPSHDKLVKDGNLLIKPSDGKCYTGCLNYTKGGKLFLKSDGICDQDCNATANICDPDCPNSPPCQNICSKENEKTTNVSPCCDGLIACPGDNVCKKISDSLACCGNDICEGRPGTPNGWGPGNKTRWETFYTCSQDCTVDPHKKLSSCQSGTFSKSVCYENAFDSQGNFVGFNPVWRDNIFGVCQSEIQKFLDRRNWDIKELIKTWTDQTPESWAWDVARYQDACNRMQSASVTVSANENYKSNARTCCGVSGAACDSGTQYFPECLGVGFCIDHSTAALSILRALGVPAKNVYSVFELTQNSAHAWVLLKCDSNEPDNRKPLECEGNWGNWLAIDATGHFVAPLNQMQYSTICLMWNDQGIYAQTEGKIDATKGYAYSTSIPRSASADPSLCMYDKLCKQQFGIDCVMP